MSADTIRELREMLDKFVRDMERVEHAERVARRGLVHPRAIDSFIAEDGSKLEIVLDDDGTVRIVLMEVPRNRVLEHRLDEEAP